MNILLIGSGGREHALAWKMKQSPLCTSLYIAPGNAGTESCGTNVNISVNDFPAMAGFVKEKQISMVVVGPEDPLVGGIHDYFLSDPDLAGISVIGPVKAGAMLEGSKDFSKQFMQEFRIPTASYQTFDKHSLQDGYRFLEKIKAPYVLKADGLAAGKGVVILTDLQEAKQELTVMLTTGKYGNAAGKVVIEEFLDGIELSVFVLTDGISYKILPEAKDYKRVGVGDTGLNTGGMGAVSPVPFADKNFMNKVEMQVIQPTLAGLKSRGITYKGFLFIGLMKVKDDPFVIEYNVRMGDPETEVVLPRIKSDLLAVFKAVAEQKLNEISLQTDPRTAVTVMLVSEGYPGEYKKGMVVEGLNEVSGSEVFHAGTIRTDEKILTSGGRVMALTSIGNTLEEALKITYANAERIDFAGKYFRNDIGADLKLLQTA